MHWLMTVLPQPPSPLLPPELLAEVRLIPLELPVALAVLVVLVAFDAEGTPLAPPAPLPPKPPVLVGVALHAENVASRAVGARTTSPLNTRARIRLMAR
jgi:hypothetical protein